MGCIYMARNKVNGKCYVGKTIGSLKARRTRHEDDAVSKNSSFTFHLALRKYGLDSFEWRVLAEEENEDDLNEAEVVYIRLLGTKRPGGYNMTDGGEGPSGCIRSEEIREKLRKSKPPGFGEKISKTRKGVPSTRAGYLHSEETKRKISESLLGHPVSEETRKRQSDAKLGKPHPPMPEETKRKISKAHKGKKLSTVQIEKMRKFLTGRRLSEEHKGKVRQGVIAYHKRKKQKEVKL